ncbi:hypothetical protein PR202_gb29332 [Eleusine coracana subsp. coracana]|uniref:Uncharacterized protein n=1 Tax=Eleusine coracana subsp. coracana TaxID=191504 RepID=A0AAV5FWT0_ELECO|nr:hypothetical protein PR202_gb29332 [Eleusine coracana subsp. coracana]
MSQNGSYRLWIKSRGAIYGKEGKRPMVVSALWLGTGYKDLWTLVGWASLIAKLWDGLSKFVGYGRKKHTNKPWIGLDIPVHSNVVAMFEIAMQSGVGNGNNTFFWKDRWLNGSSIADIAPMVVEVVPSWTRDPRMVLEALPYISWTRDIQVGLSMIGLYELFQLADIISELIISENNDIHV